jgi:polysaccharide pyruvyl transferase WcaK-like protein
MLVSRIAKHLCGGATDLPFSFSSAELNMDIDISLNCVGGAAIASWTDTKREFLKRKIQSHKGLGVRDRKTFDVLSEKADLPSLKLVPDSAILMERLLAGEMEQRKHSFSHYKSIQNNYIFFQVGCEKTDDLDEVISNLDAILLKSKFDLVLCPIGHALGHEDLLPLKTIRNALTGKHGGRVVLIEPVIDVYEIMMLISNASMYIGTSLHGTITSQSFGVPYITFNKQIKKLEEYIKTWGAPGLTTQYDAKDIAVAFDKVKGITKQSILEHTRPQKDLVTDFISELTS